MEDGGAGSIEKRLLMIGVSHPE
eukprot:COSAG02_NODE_37631_length_439_cov_1.023529_1_plen_22_part_10